MKKLKCQYLSDLHLNYHDDPAQFLDSILNPSCDLLILAGDVCYPQDLEQVLKYICKSFKYTLFVAGNHEFEGDNIADTKERIKNFNIPGFYFLDRTSIKINDILFCGASLWWEPKPDEYKFLNYRDYKSIHGLFSDLPDEYHADRDFFNSNLTNKAVAISHFLPSKKSVASKFENHIVNRFFYSNQDRLIMDKRPLLWIHGHTHFRCNYKIGNTRILCNPVGYPPYIYKTESFKNSVFLI